MELSKTVAREACKDLGKIQSALLCQREYSASNIMFHAKIGLRDFSVTGTCGRTPQDVHAEEAVVVVLRRIGNEYRKQHMHLESLVIEHLVTLLESKPPKQSGAGRVSPFHESRSETVQEPD